MLWFLTLFPLCVLFLSTTVSFSQRFVSQQSHTLIGCFNVCRPLPHPSSICPTLGHAVCLGTLKQHTKKSKPTSDLCSCAVSQFIDVGQRDVKSLLCHFLTNWSFDSISDGRQVHTYTLKTELQYLQVMQCGISKVHTTQPCLPTQLICAAPKREAEDVTLVSHWCVLHFALSLNPLCGWRCVSLCDITWQGRCVLHRNQAYYTWNFYLYVMWQ